MNSRDKRTKSTLPVTIRCLSLVVAAIACAWQFTPVFADDEDEPAVKSTAPAPDPRAFEARLNDGSQIKVRLLGDSLEVESRYGRLKIVPGDIRSIEFALRLSESMRKDLDNALAELGSESPDTVQAAAARIAALGHLAYPSLMKAAQQESTAGKRATELLGKLKEAVSEKDRSREFAPRDLDVIHTRDSTISGHIVTPVLKVETSQFGELALKITDAHGLRSLAFAPPTEIEEIGGEVLVDPGNLYSFHDKTIGKVQRFRVTGRIDGYIWGTDTYTGDSLLAKAAVHCGVVKPGKTGVVKVKFVSPPPFFSGSSRNGVDSWEYPSFHVAYQIVK